MLRRLTEAYVHIHVQGRLLTGGNVGRQCVQARPCMRAGSQLELVVNSSQRRCQLARHKSGPIDHSHNYSPGTRFLASEARIGCVVCFSFELSFFFCFGISLSAQCCVPRCSNRGRASPSLFSHGFSRSSELRKRWLLAIRQADWSHFRVPNSTVVCIEHVLPKKKFAFMLVAKSLWTPPSPVF